MSIGVQVWSGTASSNSTSDSNVNWAEGMAPSQVNDSARAVMASVAKWRDDNSGTLITAGTTTAYTITSNQVSTGNTNGYTITARFHASNDSSATLNVDGTAAAIILLTTGSTSSLSGGEFSAGSIQSFQYISAIPAWVSRTPPAVLTSGLVTYTKIQQVGASKVLGNISTSSSTVAEITIGAGGLFQTPVVTVITSTATASWQSTTQNGLFPAYLRVSMVGGGGGSAGTGGSSGVGGNGGATSFNNWTANAGAGGGIGGAGAGGAGGSGGTNGTGTLVRRLAGQPGGGGFTPLTIGGNSGLFIGAGISNASNGASAAATANSGGGAASGGIGGSGGGGEGVDFIVTSPATSYTLQVGAGGTAGSTTANTPGAAGAAGRIEVIAYWQ